MFLRLPSTNGGGRAYLREETVYVQREQCRENLLLRQATRRSHHADRDEGRFNQIDRSVVVGSISCNTNRFRYTVSVSLDTTTNTTNTTNTYHNRCLGVCHSDAKHP